MPYLLPKTKHRNQHDRRGKEINRPPSTLIRGDATWQVYIIIDVNKIGLACSCSVCSTKFQVAGRGGRSPPIGQF
jgi:hypothetical protein